MVQQRITKVLNIVDSKIFYLASLSDCHSSYIDDKVEEEEDDVMLMEEAPDSDIKPEAPKALKRKRSMSGECEATPTKKRNVEESDEIMIVD